MVLLIYLNIYPDNRYIIDDKGHKKGIMGQCKLLSNKSCHHYQHNQLFHGIGISIK